MIGHRAFGSPGLTLAYRHGTTSEPAMG
jgi:hypothetical protein